MNVTTRLDELKGKTFLINAKRQKVLNYKLENGTVILATDKDIFEFDRAELDDRLKTFLPASDGNELPILRSIKKELPSLSDIILDNIKKIQEDEKYIPQAMAIDKGVNTLINLAKTELAVMKAMNRD